MVDEEQDPDRIASMGAIVAAIQSATEGKTIGDTQAAIANVVARMAFAQENPEVVVLTTIEVISEVYRAYAIRKRSGAPTDEILN